MWQYNYTTTNELYHHGVLGMKWGRRKTKDTASYENHKMLADKSKAKNLVSSGKAAVNKASAEKLSQVNKKSSTNVGKKVARGILGGMLGLVAWGVLSNTVALTLRDLPRH